MQRSRRPPVELDAVDRRILTVLQHNARTPVKSVAASAGVAASTCAERIKGLVAQGVIRRFGVDVDFERLGRDQHALVGVRIVPHSRAIAEAFVRDVLEHHEVTAVFNVSGEEDFLVEVRVEGTVELRTFILDRIAARDNVAAVKTMLVFDHWQRIGTLDEVA